MNRTRARRGLVRLFAMVLAMVGAGLTPLALSQPAGAADDVGTRAFRYGPGLDGSWIDPDLSPTATKPQSKLWYHDDIWWGVLLHDASNQFRIHRFDPVTDSWKDTGTLVDTRERSRADALWDGEFLYTVSAVDAGHGDQNAIRFRRFTYDDTQQKYTVQEARSHTLNAGGVEAAVIAKDGTGRLWVTYTVNNKVRLVVGEDRGMSWSGVMDVPTDPPDASTGLSPDDISTVVAHKGRISVVWSKQVPPTPAVEDDPSTPEDESQPAVLHDSYLYVASHENTAAVNAGWTTEVLFSGFNMADDHISMSVDAAGERVFVVAKEAVDDNYPSGDKDPLIRLFVLEDGKWTGHVHSLVEDDLTRPIVVVDRDNDRLRVFATAPVEGGVVYEKSTSLSNPSDFGPGRGTPFLKLASDTFINNPTTTKQNVTKGSGLLVLASDQKTGWYVHNSASVPVPAPVADFTTAPDRGVFPLEVTFTNTSTNATTYTWDFGDGSPTSTEKSPTHTYAEPGGYTVTLTAGNRKGATDEVTDLVTVTHEQVVAGFSVVGDTEGTAPFTVSFSDESTGGPTTWHWDFGDGATSTEQNPTHEFTDPGVHAVSLTVDNPDSTPDTLTRTGLITVYDEAGPRLRMTAPRARFTKSRRVELRWRPAADSAAGQSYDIQMRQARHNRGFGRFTDWRTTDVNRTAFRGRPGTTYCLRVRGTDALGNTGSWSRARCTAVPLDDRNLKRIGRWRQGRSKGSYLGTVVRTKAKGAFLAKPVRGKNIALVVTKGPRMGRVAVFHGRSLVKRVGLRAPVVRKAKVVPLASYGKVRKGNLRVVVISKRRPVVIDGLAVSKR